MAPCLCSTSCSSTGNKVEYFTEGINEKGFFHICVQLCEVLWGGGGVDGQEEEQGCSPTYVVRL